MQRDFFIVTDLVVVIIYRSPELSNLVDWCGEGFRTSITAVSRRLRRVSIYRIANNFRTYSTKRLPISVEDISIVAPSSSHWQKYKRLSTAIILIIQNIYLHLHHRVNLGNSGITATSSVNCYFWLRTNWVADYSVIYVCWSYRRDRIKLLLNLRITCRHTPWRLRPIFALEDINLQSTDLIYRQLNLDFYHPLCDRGTIGCSLADKEYH